MSTWIKLKFIEKSILAKSKGGFLKFRISTVVYLLSTSIHGPGISSNDLKKDSSKVFGVYLWLF